MGESARAGQLRVAKGLFHLLSELDRLNPDVQQRHALPEHAAGERSERPEARRGRPRPANRLQVRGDVEPEPVPVQAHQTPFQEPRDERVLRLADRGRAPGVDDPLRLKADRLASAAWAIADPRQPAAPLDADDVTGPDLKVALAH